MVQSNIVPNGFKNKANSLSSTAGNQSGSELGSTNLTDLTYVNQPQTGLKGKATELAAKADLLSQKANEIVTADELSGLSGPATQLKTAAKGGTGDNTSLHHHAEELAGKTVGEAANNEADAVISAFETVEQRYGELMKQAGARKLTNNPKVTDVVKAFHDVKTIYYQMLIRYRIKIKATAFYRAANTLQSRAENAAQQSGTSPLLAALQKAAKSAMDNLVSTADTLKEEAQKLNGAGDDQIVQYYLAVETVYYALEKIPQFKAAEGVPQVTSVTTTFDALKKSYENVLRLRVQELSTLADTLSGAATAANTVQGLQSQTGKLKDAASQPGSNGLQQKADDLVNAIKGSTGGTDQQADEVITAFDRVEQKYEALTGHENYDKHKADLNVTAVVKAYTNLKYVYDQILNFTKIKHYSDKVYIKAPQIGTGTKPSEVKTLIDKLKNVYRSIPDYQADIKGTVQNDFESIKNAVYGGQSEKIQL